MTGFCNDGDVVAQRLFQSACLRQRRDQVSHLQLLIFGAKRRVLLADHHLQLREQLFRLGQPFGRLLHGHLCGGGSGAVGRAGALRRRHTHTHTRGFTDPLTALRCTALHCVCMLIQNCGRRPPDRKCGLSSLSEPRLNAVAAECS